MPPQSASNTVEISKYEVTICVQQDHAVGFVNDPCRAHATQREWLKLWRAQHFVFAS
jgi:hypothetical protein